MQTLASAEEKQGWQRWAAVCLLRWHMCSLDAPTVAVVWAVLLGKVAGVRLGAAEVLVLGLGSWIVYVVDRVLDGAGGVRAAGGMNGAGRDEGWGQPAWEQLPALEQLPVWEQLKERHHFHRRHRRVLLGLCGAAAVLLGLLCGRLPSRLVLLYVVLGVPVLVYGVRVHRRLLWASARPGGNGQRGKEAAVALLFTAAVAAPALVEAEAAFRPALLLCCVLLAGLCWLNCVLISYAEVVVVAGPLAHSSARRRERRQLAGWALVLALAAGGICGWGLGARSYSPVAGSPVAGPAAAVLLSCLLLLSLLAAWRDGSSNARRLRVLADLGLLTPLLFLIPRF